MRRLRQLEDENARLKHLVADLTLDRHIMQEVIKESSKADPAASVGDVDLRALSSQYGAGLSACALAAGELGTTAAGPVINRRCACVSPRLPKHHHASAISAFT